MTNGIESLGRIRLQGVALLVVAFLAGLAAGAAGDRLYASRRMTEGFRGLREMRGGGRLPPPLEDLNLSADQRTQVTAILERRRERTDSIMGAMMPSLRATADSMRSEIRTVLTPEQRERFDRWLPPEGFGVFRAPFGPPLPDSMRGTRGRRGFGPPRGF